MFFPLYGLILTSIQPENIIRSRNLSFFPTEIIFTHFVEVLKPNHISNIYEGIKNSLIVSSLTAFLCLILGFPASYSLSRLNMPAKNLILGALISVYFLPTILFVIPLFVILVSYQLDVQFVEFVTIQRKTINEPKIITVFRGKNFPIENYNDLLTGVGQNVEFFLNL